MLQDEAHETLTNIHLIQGIQDICRIDMRNKKLFFYQRKNININ